MGTYHYPIIRDNYGISKLTPRECLVLQGFPRVLTFQKSCFKINVPKKKLNKRPVVVGCGPAGMFAVLILAQSGANPILLERGLDVDSRS